MTQRHDKTISLTEFVEDERVRLHPLRELVRLAADEDWHVECFGHQGHLGGADAGHDAAVGEDGVGAKEHKADLMQQKEYTD